MKTVLDFVKELSDKSSYIKVFKDADISEIVKGIPNCMLVQSIQK